jgi:astacin
MPIKPLRIAVCLSLVASVAWADGPGATREQGIFRGQKVSYLQAGGLKMFEGDMLLDHVVPFPTRGVSVRPDAIGIAYAQYLWPADTKGVAEIPYIVTSAATNLNQALTAFNKTFEGVIQFVKRDGQADYVNFNFDPNNFSGQCESYVGHIGGEQATGGSGACSLGTLLHEMGHIVGLYHEQSRPDRNSYITVNFANVIKGSEGNFDQPQDNLQDLGLFDYASIMEYIPYAFTRNGAPVIETIPPGMPLSNQTGYTAADIDGVKRLYGKFPHTVTVTSNPPSLSVMVDGATVTTPATFTWALKSTHTLAVPPSAQTLAGGTYVYGRWNDSTAASHSITVAQGNNMVTQPGALPAVTVYTANFIQLSAYSAQPYVAGTGSVSASPAPKTYPGANGSFFVARQPVTLTASPSAGEAFVTWGGTSAPYSANPKADYVPDGAVPYPVTAYFSADPITTIQTNPGGFYFTVDGAYYKSPQSFAADVFSGWGAGSTHTLAAFSPTQPYGVNTQYIFDSWSDGGALSHAITVPTGSSTVTGNFTAQYVPIVYANPACAGTVTLAPSSTTGFYNSGTVLKVTETPAAGWTLTGWTGDLGTKRSVQTLTVSDEELAVANYNISATNFSLTSLSPASMVQGGAGGTVKIRGTGFTSTTQAYVNGPYRYSTYVSPTEIDVALTASDIATAGALPIGVANFTSACSAYQALGFFVLR